MGQVGQVLRGQGPILVALDNFEQVVAYAEQTVGRWRAAAPEVARDESILALGGLTARRSR